MTGDSHVSMEWDDTAQQNLAKKNVEKRLKAAQSGECSWGWAYLKPSSWCCAKIEERVGALEKLVFSVELN